MTYALQRLLELREFRERTAQQELLARRRLFDASVKLEEERKNKLSEHRTWRSAREDAMYEGVRNQHIALKDLEALKQTIGWMRDQESLLEKEREEARKKRETAGADLEKARSCLHAAVREKEKIVAHKDIWLEDMRKEEALRQDLEMEEYRKNSISPDSEVEDDEDSD